MKGYQRNGYKSDTKAGYKAPYKAKTKASPSKQWGRS